MQLDTQRELVGINKGCLQKPHPQTHHKNPAYFPHMRITAAKKYKESANSGWESVEDLREFMASEEAKIDRKFISGLR